MKIGIISDTFYPQVGGAEVHVEQLALKLKNKGYEVAILTATPGENSYHGIPVKRVPYLRGGGKRALLNIFKGYKEVLKFVREHDIIHAHYTYFLTFLASIACQKLKIPMISTLHGLGTLDSSVNKSIFRRLYRKLSFKGSSIVISTSDEMADVARRFVSNGKVKVIPNGVDTNYYKSEKSELDNKNTDITVLTMRRFHPKNGVQYLIESIPYITEKMQNIKFLIIGSKRLEDYLKNRVNELGIQKYVTFIPEVPNTKTKEYYEKADIIAFPSSAESTSIACLEAMSLEKAVIASSLSAYKYMLGKNERGILIDLFDRDYSDYDAPLTLPEEKYKLFAREILNLAQDQDLRYKLGKSARKYAKEHFDWDVIVSEVSNYYETLFKK